MIYPRLDVGKRSLSSRTMPLCQYAHYDYDMKRTRLEMIEEPEAFQRFRDAAKKVLTVPKSSVTNPFGKRPKRKSPLRVAALFNLARFFPTREYNL